MADDFEKAVLFSFDQTGNVDPALKVRPPALFPITAAALIHTLLQDRAVAYCNETKAQPQCWQLCLEKYSTTTYLEVRFWCLQTMHEVCSESAYTQYVCFRTHQR